MKIWRMRKRKKKDEEKGGGGEGVRGMTKRNVVNNWKAEKKLEEEKSIKKT